MTNGTGCSPPSQLGSATRRRCWTANCRRRSPTTRPPPGSTCCPAAASSGRAAAARTTPTRASTRRPPATWSPTRWTPTRSPCSCCAAAPATRCWPGYGPAGAARRAQAQAERAGSSRRWHDGQRRPASRGRRGRGRQGGVRHAGIRGADPGRAAAAPRGPGRPPRFPWIRRRGASGLREDLVELAADAASRAWEMAVGLSADAGLSLDPDADLARRAARALGTPAFGALAARSGIGAARARPSGSGLAAGRPGGTGRAARRVGPGRGRSGRRPACCKAARAALRAKTGAAQAVTQGNRVTAGRLQLRLGRDLRWYPYARSDDDWEPSGAPEPDPARALADL